MKLGYNADSLIMLIALDSFNQIPNDFKIISAKYLVWFYVMR
jgi:hypothetical protein